MRNRRGSALRYRGKGRCPRFSLAVHPVLDRQKVRSNSFSREDEPSHFYRLVAKIQLAFISAPDQ